MTRTARLGVVLTLNLSLVAVLVAVGSSAHSFAVFAEGTDYLADAAGVGVSLLAVRLAGRPSTPARPIGHPKAPAIAALVNTGWLLALSAVVLAGAVDRLVTGTHQVHGIPVLVVSGIAAVVMLICALVLGGDADDEDADGALNMRAVLLDTIADAATAAGVAVAGAIIAVHGGWYWLDPTVALVVSAIVTYHAVRLLHEVVTALSCVES